ncbi:hypothetical protein Dip518_000154 [Parelusimicrobium proximum]|uniref:hypothetical protein n=1 Tax=Parelusimicrobium proximum TaxID=3228953 RepID=UPI003D1641BB
MKKYILPFVTLLFSAPLLAAPMSHLSGFEEDKNTFLAYKLIDPYKTDYNFCVEAAPDVKTDKIIKRTKQAFYDWTLGIAEIIRKSGRTEEFADIIEILAKPVNLQMDSACERAVAQNRFNSTITQRAVIADKYDLILLVDPLSFKGRNFGITKTLAFFSRDIQQGNPGIAIPGEKTAKNFNNYLMLKTAQSVFTHEMGHAFGLGDQYKKGAGNSDALYSTFKQRRSIMNEANSLSCDDADGIITLIDRARGQKRTFASLCRDGVVFKNGMQMIEKESEKILYTKKKNYKVTNVYIINPDTYQDKEYTSYKKMTFKLNNANRYLISEFELEEDVLRGYYGKKVNLYISGEVQDGQYKSHSQAILDLGDRQYFMENTFHKSGTSSIARAQLSKEDFTRLKNELPKKLR